MLKGAGNDWPSRCPWQSFSVLAVIVGDHDRVDHETATHEGFAQAQYVYIVCDAQVTTDLVFLNVDGTDDDDDFGFVDKLGEHLQLTVGLKTGQHTAGMKIVEEFATKFQIKLISKFGDAFLDMF